MFFGSAQKIEKLNSTIIEKDKEIEELKQKLKLSEDNAIINVESFKSLNSKIDILENEKRDLTLKIESLSKELENSSKSIVSLNQLEIMEKNLKKAKDDNKTLSDERDSLKERVNTLEAKVSQVENSSVSPKQMEIMERNLKNARNENLELKEKLSHYEETAKEVVRIKIEERPREFSENAIILDEFKYKILTEDFYNATKFKEIKDFLVKNDYLFINDIEDLASIEGIEKRKNFKSAYAKFQNFKNGVVPLEDRVLLCKGAKVQKIFKSYRKFTNYLLDNNMEYMFDLDGADFKALSVKASIMAKSVKDIMTVAEKYFETYKIK